MTVEPVHTHRLPIWAAIVTVVVIATIFALPAGRNLLSKFFGSLRMQQPQTVNVNLSNFVGPDANRTLQQMVTQMISDKVTTVTNEKPQSAQDVAAATQLAGFPVQLPSDRKDAPELTVGGERAFNLVVDRGRLQAILNEAGRPDLVLPQSVDGATVSVHISRNVRARYGNCPKPPSATANVATPPPSSLQYSDCLVLTEGHSPVVNAPSGLDFKQLAQIGLELAGMTPPQARDFLKTVDWQSTLGMPIPRFMRSYEQVKVSGAQGTLLNMAGRQGPTYALLWAKNGIVYSLTGFGSSSEAVSTANSIQ